MTTHTIKQGEHISKIALKYGFRDYRTVWNAPENSDLKKKRVNPNVLLPGDILYIPDLRTKTETRPTDKKHVFKVITPKLMLRLVVVDFDNQPLSNTKCELDVEGKKYPLISNSDGKIEQPIPIGAESARLSVPSIEREWEVKIGHLDPHDEDTGWQQRLINMGYYPKALYDKNEMLLREWIEEFQCDYGLPVTGKLDVATENKLKTVHGC